MLIALITSSCAKGHGDSDQWSSTADSLNHILGGFGALVTAQEAANLTAVKYTQKHLKMAVFVGYETYRVLMRKRFRLTTDDQIHQFIQSYVGQIASVFRQSSLGGILHMHLVDIVIHKTPDQLQTHNGDRDKLLNSFCDYQALIKPQSWHVALYLTSLNLYSINESGEKDYNALGISPIGGICQQTNGCVIVELGPVNETPEVEVDKVYPSGGFASAWIAAHEIAHNLGILHDGDVNQCPNNLYLMSGSRGYIGKNTWSHCSARHFSLLRAPCLERNESTDDADTRFPIHLLPGLVFDVHSQCKHFLGRMKSQAVNISNEMCSQSVYCSHVKVNGLRETIATTPALEGTVCAPESICLDTVCTRLPFN